MYCIVVTGEPSYATGNNYIYIENFVKFRHVVFTARAMLALQALY